MAEGATTVRNFSPAAECGKTLAILSALGVEVERQENDILVHGMGPRGLTEPTVALDCGRSASLVALAAGLLSGAPFQSVLTGEGAVTARSVERVAEPLRQMGARVHTATGDGLPVMIEGGDLHGIEYRLRSASTRVKSAVLLAGVQASGETSVVEPFVNGDHTERLLKWAGAPIRRTRSDSGLRTAVTSGHVQPFELDIPGDLSAAAPLIAAAAVTPRSDLRIDRLGLNPTRTAFLRILEQMGARIEVVQQVDVPEPFGDVRVRGSVLHGVSLGPMEVTGTMAELPLLAFVASRAKGVTRVQGGPGHRLNESDRIAGALVGLRALGAQIQEMKDGFSVTGPRSLRGARVDARGDHRVAMAFTVAGLGAEGLVHVDGMEAISESFPGFQRTLEGLMQEG
jgi:3-phosphoshikimate 1-carboxyvinyltransferase